MSDTELNELMLTYSQILSTQIQQFEVQNQRNAEVNDMLGKLATYTANNRGSIILNTNKGKKKEKKYYIPKSCLLRQRKDDNRWEARIMINGKQKFVACRLDKKYVYAQLMKAYRELHPRKQPSLRKEKELTLFAWLDHWHQVYRIPKLERKQLSQNTIIMNLSMIRKIKKTFDDVKLKDLKSSYVQERLNSMERRRTAESIYTMFTQAAVWMSSRGLYLSILTLQMKSEQ